MKTVLEKINFDNRDDLIYLKAVRIIQQGGLVAFPTETVYGLGADGLNKEAAAKIYEAKGRPSDNPLILHIADQGQLEGIVKEIPLVAQLLINSFWPGPLTLIFQKADKVPYETTGGLNTVAVRMPNHSVALRFIKETGVAIAAPSANTSGRPSPTLASHVAADLSAKVDMIMDGGAVEIGIESTIVDVTVDPPMILRSGSITRKMLENVLGITVAIDEPVNKKTGDEFHPKAPGMKYRHYAPSAELIIIEGESERAAKEIIRLAADKKRQGFRVGILGTTECESYYHGEIYKIMGSQNNKEAIAHNLYRVLREFDDLPIDIIYAEGISQDNLGFAIMNRLTKAAGQHIIKV